MDDNPATSLTLGYDDCILMVTDENDGGSIVNGTLTIEWDDSNGREMTLTILAHDNTFEAVTDLGPSPTAIALPAVSVSFVDPVRFDFVASHPPGELMTPVTATFDATITGETTRAFSANC